MSVYINQSGWDPASRTISTAEVRLTATQVRDRFTEEIDPPRNKTRIIQHFLELTKPDPAVLNAWATALRTFVDSNEPKFLLDFARSDRLTVYRLLFDTIVETFPNPALLLAVDAAKQRAATRQAEGLAKREAARQEYNHILACTAKGQYGAKLKLLIEGGWVKLGPPQSGDAYMSVTEKRNYRKNMASIHQADFGVSRPIQGTIPDEHPPEDRLELHEHCSYTGQIQVASIQKEAEAGEPGIQKRWLEKECLSYFTSAAITRANLLGKG